MQQLFEIKRVTFVHNFLLYDMGTSVQLAETCNNIQYTFIPQKLKRQILFIPQCIFVSS